MTDYDQPSLFDFDASGNPKPRKTPGRATPPKASGPSADGFTDADAARLDAAARAAAEAAGDFSPTASAVARKSSSASASSAASSPTGLAPVIDATHGGEGPVHRMMDTNFLQYAAYVIRDRAIPELDDGLKPVQRRILHALRQMDDGRFIKVANVVGQTMAYHPHGDASIGDALVTLVNRGFLIEGQGNFGNIHTGDPAAAPRYIECRLTDLAATQVFNEDLTEFIPSYDGRNKEPVTLPAKIPLLLMLGTEGIAVGLSTRILPHNFAELLKAQIAILRKKPFEIFPDFQTGGLLDARDYDEGRGKVRIRAVIEQKDEATLVIRELPYAVTTEALIASIEDAAKKGRLQIKAIRDYTAKNVEIELAIPSSASIDKTLKALYAFTLCESSISLRPIVIRDRRPVELSVHDILRHNTARLVDLLHRELELERGRIDEALQKASLVRLFIIHRIYKRIESCKTALEVKQAVFNGLEPYRDQLRRDITADDIDMLLAIPIRRISLYDLNKSRKEEDDLLADYDAVLKHLANVTAYAIGYLRNLLRDYGDLYPRRTKLQSFETVQVRAIATKSYAIRHDPEKGYVGYGDVDADKPLFSCSEYDRVVIVWKTGAYRVIPPPEKLFVDQGVVYVGLYDRDRVMTLVYVADQIVHLKRFTFGGVILNKDYQCAPPPAEILFFSDTSPAALYVKYAPRKGQQIHQQVFDPTKIAVRSAHTRGNQMTTKKIASISTEKPRNWDDSAPAGKPL
ncbi:MAG: DNA topoisomerase IV subunit A [Kiritimatiellae bacterium]|nr:DNA topoisomerase IV subunit A [Kiritimatiellia bacterium]